MTGTIKALREEGLKLNKQARDIIDAADGRDLTSEESAKVDAIYDKFEEGRDTIDRAERSQAARDRVKANEDWLEKSAGRMTDPTTPSAGHGGVPPVRTPHERADPSTYKVGRHPVRLHNQALQDRAGDDYRRAVESYLRSGGRDVSAVLHVGSDPQGGYLTSLHQSNELIKFVDDAVFMRQISNVLPPLERAVGIGMLSWDTDPNDSDWTAEVPSSDISEDTAAALGKREMMPHLMSKRVDLSTKLIRSASIDVVSLVTSRIGYKMGITEEKAFLTGDGAQQPLGVFVASANGISTGRDVTASAATSYTADDVIDTFYTLKGQYQMNASWLVHRDWIKRLRKKKTGTGDYLWQPAITAGEPATILGRPYFMSEHVPNTFTTGLYTAIVGDFRAGYYIVDTLDTTIQVLDQIAALKNKMVYVGRKETDGQPVLEEAFARMVLA